MAIEKLQHIITKDGSSTLYTPQYDEHYHSVNGAIQESMHVFIGAGLGEIAGEKQTIAIFEMGFGTGLNALLTYLWRGNSTIIYTTIESTPVPPEQALSLNYPEALGEEGLGEVFEKIHHAPWNEPVAITDRFQLLKLHTRLQDIDINQRFDLVYFDAFAPSAQPELWELPVLQQMFDLLNPGGIFVTYSAKGTVRRGLIDAGFEVEKIPGPPGKREMLRGRKGVASRE